MRPQSRSTVLLVSSSLMDPQSQKAMNQRQVARGGLHRHAVDFADVGVQPAVHGRHVAARSGGGQAGSELVLSKRKNLVIDEQSFR